jgi:hypothetical protein
MLAIGFDPSFIDTLVRAQKSDGTLADELPPPGHHHRDSYITRIAGGNGVNISVILTKLGVDNILVAPCNSEFRILLNKRGINNIEGIDSQINETVGVTWVPGDIQFNYVKHGLFKEHWTKNIHELWRKSEVQTYLNWGLNPKALEWVSTQWLATCGWNFEEIKAETNVIDRALTVTDPVASFLIEPGSIRFHIDNKELMKILSHIAKHSWESEYAILSANEEEFQEYSSIDMKQNIVHTSNYVKFTDQETDEMYNVEKLHKEPLTYVGAGDAFIAGIIKSMYDLKLDIGEGIETARKFLQGDL